MTCSCGHAVIPSIEMAAAGLDSIGAIVGFAVCSGIAIPSGNLVYSICSGPLQVVYGLILACIGTLICSCTRFWNNRFKRAAAIFFTGAADAWQASATCRIPATARLEASRSADQWMSCACLPTPLCLSCLVISQVTACGMVAQSVKQSFS